jgi:hypothetical protein
MTMPAPGEQSPQATGDEVGVVIEAVSLLDRSRQNYFDACADFAQKPKPKTFYLVTQSLEHYADTFDLLVNVLPEEGSLDEYGRALGHLHTFEDNNRVSFLNALLGKDILKPASLEFVDETDGELKIAYTPEQLSVLKAKASQLIKDLFRAGLEKDTGDFAEEVSESAPAKKIDRREAVLKHALDVGKIAAGTVLGIMASKMLREKY